MNPNTRPTLKMVTDKIQSVTYTRLPSGTAIVCEITLHNLHRCHGIAVVVDMDNDNPEIGKKIAYDKAILPIFDIVAYEMHTKMHVEPGSLDNLDDDPEISNRHRELCEIYAERNAGHPQIVGQEITQDKDSLDIQSYPYGSLCNDLQRKNNQGRSIIDMNEMVSGKKFTHFAMNKDGAVKAFESKPVLSTNGLWAVGFDPEDQGYEIAQCHYPQNYKNSLRAITREA